MIDGSIDPGILIRHIKTGKYYKVLGFYRASMDGELDGTTFITYAQVNPTNMGVNIACFTSPEKRFREKFERHLQYFPEEPNNLTNQQVRELRVLAQLAESLASSIKEVESIQYLSRISLVDRGQTIVVDLIDSDKPEITSAVVLSLRRRRDELLAKIKEIVNNVS